MSRQLLKILKYSFLDMVRGKWSFFYALFFIAVTYALLYFSGNLSKAILSLMNIVLLLIPLVSTIMGVTYYYNSVDFSEMLLAQPIKRSSVFLGRFLGLTLSLCISFILGTFIPFVTYSVSVSSEIWNFSMLIFNGMMLTFIFTGFAFLSCTIFTDRIKGFGLAVFIWLFMAVIYDGLFLLVLLLFNDYPLEKPAIILSMINPIDLARTLLMLKLDIAALLGYTGAVFKHFFGSHSGILISVFAILMWAVFPVFLFIRIARKKDF